MDRLHGDRRFGGTPGGREAAAKESRWSAMSRGSTEALSSIWLPLAWEMHIFFQL